jgi:hypothetical protein
MTNRRVESILTSAYAISQENTTESQAIIRLKTVIQEYKDLGYSDVQITAALQRRLIMDEQSNSATLRAQERLDRIIQQALGN